MAKQRRFRGKTTQARTPDWQPLIDLVMTDWMWMFEVRLSNGRKAHAYKHYWTRRYVHIGEDGTGFVYIDGEPARYEAVDALWLLGKALEPLFEPGMSSMGTPPWADAEEVPRR